METTMTDQLRQLFLSCGLGFLLGVFYDGFRVFRMIVKSKGLAVFIQDLLFFVLAAFITFLFSLAVMDGNLRFYLFLGEAVGFFAYYYTTGRLVKRFAQRVIAVIVAVWTAFWRVVLAPFRWTGRKIYPLYKKICENLRKKAKKVWNNLKKGLKRPAGLVYNQKESKGSTDSPP